MACQAKPSQDPVDDSEMGLDMEAALEMLREQVREKNGNVEKHLKQNPPTAAAAEEDHFKVLLKPTRERRKWKWFTIDGAVVTVVKPSFWSALKPAHIQVGPLKDIGMKGLAVHYAKKNEPILKKAGHMSIMFPGEGTVVDKIPFKIVNNFRVAALPNGNEVWNLCVSFERLPPIQRHQIETFIEDYGNELQSTWAGQTANAGE